MAAWNERHGNVSRAFDEWKLVEADIRAFTHLGLAFAEAEFDRIWKEVSEAPGDPDGPGLPDVFEARVGNLYPQDFDWMLLSGALRDSVTSFEVYLEKAREEVLRHHGQPIEVADNSPYWRELRRFFAQLGVTIETDGVKAVRDLRHFLAHRRGELRTEALRKAFPAEEDSGAFPPLEVELTEQSVTASMDTLASAARAIDAQVYAHSWGGTRIKSLKP